MTSDWNSTGIRLKFIQELQNYCSSNDLVDKVILFGSRARGDHRKTSDIDLAIFTKNASHTQQNIILQTINEMPTPLKLDVLFVDRIAKEKLIVNILNDGVLVYEKGEAIREA